MLEEKELEFELKMQEKQKERQEETKRECARMRRMTAKVMARLKPKQAEMIQRAGTVTLH